MKLIKSLLVIAIVSMVAISCGETKKEAPAEGDAVEAVEEGTEAVEAAADEATEAAEEVMDSVEVDAEKAVDSAKTMADAVEAKCEGKCSEDGKSCDGSCKA